MITHGSILYPIYLHSVHGLEHNHNPITCMMTILATDDISANKTILNDIEYHQAPDNHLLVITNEITDNELYDLFQLHIFDSHPRSIVMKRILNKELTGRFVLCTARVGELFRGAEFE